MDSVFVVPLLAAAIFVLAKILEMRFSKDDERAPKALKTVVRDAVFVLASTIIASAVFSGAQGSLTDLMGVLTAKKTVGGGVAAPEVFTDVPGF
jgi:hypothetical protein